MKKNTTRLMIITALLTALCAVSTAFISFPVLSNGGYIHFGDAVIMIAAAILPAPYALFAGAIGGALGDLLVGAALWAPFTLIIKAAVSLCITNKKEKMLCVRNVLGLIPIFAITIVGYYLAEAVLYGNWIAPLAAMIGNLVQAAGSSIIFIVFSVSLDALGFKKKFNTLIGK